MYFDQHELSPEQARAAWEWSHPAPLPALGTLPPPQCGQCEYFRQGKHAIATGAEYGFCDLQDLERHQSAQPCGLFVSAIPF